MLGFLSFCKVICNISSTLYAKQMVHPSKDASFEDKHVSSMDKYKIFAWYSRNGEKWQIGGILLFFDKYDIKEYQFK